MGYTASFTHKMKKSELIELLNKVHDENCELKRYCNIKDDTNRNANTESAGWRKKFEEAQHKYIWLKKENETLKQEIKDISMSAINHTNQLKDQIDKQHEEIQEIKNKLKAIIG